MSGAVKQRLGCRKCGSVEFDIFESYVQSGEVFEDEPDTILCKAQDDGGVESIRCAKCGAEAPPELSVEFC